MAHQSPPWQRRHETPELNGGHRETIPRFRQRETKGPGASRDRFDRGPVRANAKVRPGQLHGLGQAGIRDLTAARATAEIDPTVRTPPRRVDPALQRTGAKPGEKRLPHLGLAVAITIREEENVRRTGDDQAAPRRHQAISWQQVRRSNLRVVHTSVTIGVPEELDHAVGSRRDGILEPFLGLDPANHGVELSALVEFLDVELAFEILPVELADEKAPVLVPAQTGG